ncbi:unnamed protein product [Penicillium camemberti]|uniref:Str. FM013 n=1 Tax=Penicillium camemberti (strain FM 013) TaxID=1429867 RepID=A0A0G4PQL8_PENC3|nr:unnamed protein product [Penicillium camemberti]
MTSANSQNPSHRTHDRSMMHIDQLPIEPRKTGIASFSVSFFCRGVLWRKPGPVREYLYSTRLDPTNANGF